jgi:hypothetical protein
LVFVEGFRRGSRAKRRSGEALGDGFFLWLR